MSFGICLPPSPNMDRSMEQPSLVLHAFSANTGHRWDGPRHASASERSVPNEETMGRAHRLLYGLAEPDSPSSAQSAQIAGGYPVTSRQRPKCRE